MPGVFFSEVLVDQLNMFEKLTKTAKKLKNTNSDLNESCWTLKIGMAQFCSLVRAKCSDRRQDWGRGMCDPQQTSL